MPEPTPADALERMRRQVRAVRWRQNLHELQRALYHLLATLAAAATALVVLALLCTPGLFAAAAWGLGAGSVLLAAWITRALGRRRLSARAADRSVAPAGCPGGRIRPRPRRLPGPRRDRTQGPTAGAGPPLRAARPARRGRLGALAPAGRAPGAHPGPALGRGS